MQNKWQPSVSQVLQIKGALLRFRTYEVQHVLSDSAADRAYYDAEMTRQMAAIMAEINAASREQSVGVDQLSRSLVAIDESTRHDAELAVHSLASTAGRERQAVGLGRLVAAFRLPNGAAPALEQGRPGLRRVPALPLPA